MRRAEDRKKIVFLDRYSKSIFVATVLVLVLSIIDALMTIYLIDHGAIELNPIMRFYIDMGPVTFIIVKYLLTAASVMLIVMSHYSTIPVLRIFNRNLLMLFAGGFAIVVTWQIFLTFRHIL